jgi:CBS domain containing-hemolysin-like protein
MRETSNQLALVTRDETVVGVVAITDVLRRLFPRGGNAERTPTA